MSGSRAARRSTAAQGPKKDSPAKGPWLHLAVLLLSCICLLGLFSTEIGDTDFWWHLRTGQYIVDRHSLPVPDPFAYTTALAAPAYPGEDRVRHFNLTHEWLAQVLMYLVYAIGGLPALILARSTLLATLCGLAGFLAAHRSQNFWAGVAAAFATASLAVEFRADRPTLVTFLFVAVFVTLLELRWALWALPALALLWANCHGGFFLGWVVLVAYCLTNDWRRIGLVAACSIALSAVNPNGFGVVLTLLGYRRGEMTANLIEWHAPYLWGPPYAFDILLYAAALVLIVSWRKVRLVDWILFAAFAGASLIAFRNILLVGFLAPVLIAAYFPFRFRLPRVLAWAVPVALAIAIVVGVGQGWMFQLRPAAWTIPAGAADYLLANHLSARMFNTYEQGGYLIWKLWPRERVFIDGRALSETVNKDYRQILYNLGSAVDQVTGPRAELLNRYGVQVVVMNTLEYVSGAIYPLAIALANPATKDWQLVYDDPQALVFLRNPPAGTNVFPNKLGQVLNHLDAECEADIEHSPDTPVCARTLADYWLRNGLKDRGRRMLSLYLSHATERDAAAEKVWQQLGGGPIPKR